MKIEYYAKLTKMGNRFGFPVRKYLVDMAGMSEGKVYKIIITDEELTEKGELKL